MNPSRVAVKLFVEGKPSLDAHAFIAIFHRFIQQGAVEGFLIDVADYAHVPNGPGVLLIGHDVDYAVDESDGRAGLLVTRKRLEGVAPGPAVRETLRMALGAAIAIEEAPEVDLRFSTRSVDVQVLDRAVAPNSSEAYEQVAKEIEPVLREVYADAALEIARAETDDARQPLTLAASAPDAADAAALLERLGGSQASGPPKQSDWDISVEDLKKLRDDGADITLVDVREPNEYEVANLGGTLIPLGTLPEKLGELDKGAHVVVHCQIGLRGAKGTAILREAGFDNAWNVNGGLDAWIRRIDPKLGKS